MTSFRTGLGHDVHRLFPDHDLVLGGVVVSQEVGFNTHSDGDVLSHALVDALAGAIADGDLGTHYPENDPDAEDARSLEFVREFSGYVLKKYLHEAFVIRRARWGPAWWNFNTLPESPTAHDVRRIKSQEVPRQRVRRRGTDGDNWVVEAFETPSPTTGRRVMCFEVQNGFGLRMGWAFFRYHRTPEGRGVCEIPELFVWPIFRRMGLGRYLEDVAVDYATAWGCHEIHLMMNEADATIGNPRAAARLFGQAMGYEWRWRNQTFPRRSATGVKRIVPGPRTG